jgi:hypothetical protein
VWRRETALAGEPSPSIANFAMFATLFDWVLLIGAACSGLAVAITCAVGVVVWLAGGERRARN